MRSTEDLQLCVNYPIQREVLERSVDKRYNVRSVLCIRFASSKMCQKICTKIMNKRNAYFEAARKRIMSLIDECDCLLNTLRFPKREFESI